MKLSILDQVAVSRGESPNDAIQHTIDLVKYAEDIGYDAYYVAEHHNTSGLISHAPEILMTRLLSVTRKIHVGSAGILLPQYSPYKIAENAKLLEAMFPGRVIIGLGNSPGGSEITRSALTDGGQNKVRDYDRLIEDFLGFLHNTLPLTHPYRTVKAGPRITHHPKVMTLGLTDNGAMRAARLGIGFVFGNFISDKYIESSIKVYREAFVPSQQFSKPYVIFSTFIIVARDEIEVKMQQTILDHWLLNVSKGRDTVVPSYEQVQKLEYNDADLKLIHKNRGRYIIGTKAYIKDEILKLYDRYHFDELMVINNTHDFYLKKESYRKLKTIIEEINQDK